MDYKTDYIVVEGHRVDFEKEMNKLSKHGYVRCGNMNTNIDGKCVLHSQLMCKEQDICK